MKKYWIYGKLPYYYSTLKCTGTKILNAIRNDHICLVYDSNHKINADLTIMNEKIETTFKINYFLNLEEIVELQISFNMCTPDILALYNKSIAHRFSLFLYH